MTMDDHPGLLGASWPTLTEAATLTGHTREALRLRVRRGKLRAIKGNDGITRLNPSDLNDLPPLENVVVDLGRPADIVQSETLDDISMTLDVLRSTLDRTLDDLGQTRSTMDRLNEDRLVDRGRAERAEAKAQAEMERAADLEARLRIAEDALANAREPWVVRVVRGLRGRT